MKGDKEREEICKTRKDAGLNCNGCQYKMIRDGEKLQEKCKTITVILKDTKAALEEGKIIETYNKLQKMIEYMEAEDNG